MINPSHTLALKHGFCLGIAPKILSIQSKLTTSTKSTKQATNFMIRDQRMMQLVDPSKEPISPYISKVSLSLSRSLSLSLSLNPEPCTLNPESCTLNPEP